MKKTLLTIALGASLLIGCTHKNPQKEAPYDGMPFDMIYIHEEYEIDDVGVIVYENPEDNFEPIEICFEICQYEEILKAMKDDFFYSGHLQEIGRTIDGTPVFILNTNPNYGTENK